MTLLLKRSLRSILVFFGYTPIRATVVSGDVLNFAQRKPVEPIRFGRNAKVHYLTRSGDLRSARVISGGPHHGYQLRRRGHRFAATFGRTAGQVFAPRAAALIRQAAVA